MKNVKICPRCGSRRIVLSTQATIGYMGYHTPLVCKNCGFSSILFPEVSREEARKIKVVPKEKLKKIKYQEYPMITFYGSLKEKWWGISGPLAIIFSSIFMFFSETILWTIIGFWGVLIGVWFTIVANEGVKETYKPYFAIFYIILVLSAILIPFLSFFLV